MQEISLEHRMLTLCLSSMVKSVTRVGGGEQERADGEPRTVISSRHAPSTSSTSTHPPASLVKS